MEFLLDDIMNWVGAFTNAFDYIYTILDRNVAEIILDVSPLLAGFVMILPKWIVEMNLLEFMFIMGMGWFVALTFLKWIWSGIKGIIA